ncbi:permease [Tepidibacter thalassicus]|uniref:Ferredoxin n=1 Tax=Tepidibacter thalassicus DSM 15285 TaxID=1123350 RepID=A0A1M5NX18_9FIRM|nr:permease [Tepidibacter thalassicus]SHG94134.1 Ferredoxin [Tepidibacter thalassicus DSM 15285]
MKQIIRKNKTLIIAIIGYIALFLYNTELGLKALNESKYYFVEMIKILPAVFVLTSLIQTWVPTEVIMKNFGNKSGIKGKALSFAIGSLSAGPIYAAFPVCRTLIDKGASVENIIIILSSWAVVKVPMLINEAKFMGVKYMCIRWIFTIIAIFLMAQIMKLWIKESEIKEKEVLNFDMVVVNEDICIGCGSCARKFPEIYKMKNGKAIVIDNITEKVSKEEIEKSKKSCPVHAIS